VLVPIFQGAYYSVFDWNGLEPITDFVGLQNYRDALADPVFLGSLRHVMVILLLSLAVQLPFALGLAVLLNQRIRGRAALRLLFFLPYVLSEVITAVVFRLLLQPDGLLDRTLETVGLGAFTRLWLADPDVVLFTVFVVVSWKYFGFHMILYLAGLQQIPRELHEAAALDGASHAQAFRHVTLPLLGPTIRISVFLSIIGSLQLFDMVWVLTGGGPVNASNTMAVYMIDRGFERSQFGYGSAVAVIVFLIAFVFALAYQRFALRRDVSGALTAMRG
jgi:raffinose/stachyose/melibiose transport system permease protein